MRNKEILLKIVINEIYEKSFFFHTVQYLWYRVDFNADLFVIQILLVFVSLEVSETKFLIIFFMYDLSFWRRTREYVFVSAWRDD